MTKAKIAIKRGKYMTTKNDCDCILEKGLCYQASGLYKIPGHVNTDKTRLIKKCY